MSRWIKLSDNFEYAPPPAPSAAARGFADGPSTVAYRTDGPKGGVYHMPDAHADAAIAAGKGVEVEAPASRAEVEAIRSGEAEAVVVQPDAEATVDTKPAGGKSPAK